MIPLPVGSFASEMPPLAIEALYSLSYALKFEVKKGPSAVDYGVMPLKGLWWWGDLAGGDKSAMSWTAMILQPDFITEPMVEPARRKVPQKKNPVALARLRLDRLHEGASAQLLPSASCSSNGCRPCTRC